MRFLLSNGGAPETFAAPMVLKSTAISHSTKPLSKELQAMTMGIGGIGEIAVEDMPKWEESLKSGGSVRARLEIVFGDFGTKTITGTWHFRKAKGRSKRISIDAQADELSTDWIAGPG